MITVRVVPDEGEPFDVTATARDIVIWEKTHKGRKLSDIEDASMTLLYELAYSAASRQKLFTGSEAEFMASVDLDMRQDDAADPTK